MIELDEQLESAGLFPRRIRKSEIVYVTSQLAIMVDTGINLAAALEGVSDQADNPTLRAMLIELRKNVEAGQDFSSALAQFPKYFDRTFIALVKTSEQTGSLGTMLEQISTHMTFEMDARRKGQNKAHERQRRQQAYDHSDK
jgi:type IV pilus assembly protein PilC